MAASEGAFTEAFAILRDPAEGEMGAVERTVRSFITDYKIAVEQGALSVTEFELSKRELYQRIDTIEEQRAAIQRLSAPIIDVWEGVVTVPLIGALDLARMSELRERLLSAIQRSGAQWVIFDLTGVEELDERCARALVGLADAVRLMGSRCLLTGIREQVAQAMVSTDIELTGLTSISTLKEGLRYCLSQHSDPGRRHRRT
ncbi:MAG: STAS domain-containing protein [Nannocystaceae bacterium]